MAAKKPADFSKIRAAAGKTATVEATGSPTEPQKASAGGKGAKTAEKPSRAKKTLVGGHFSPEVGQQLRILAAEQGKTNQQLLGEALNHLFAAYGKAEIADTEKAER